MSYIPTPWNVLSLPGIVGRQWWSAERLRRWQEARLKWLVSHAHERVPFYRAKWDEAGVSPRDIRTLEDLGRLPVISSREFKSARYEDTIAAGTDLKRCRLHRTSGTTGEPLTGTFRLADNFQMMKAMSVRHYRAHGVGLRDRLVLFAGNPADCGVHGWYEKFGFWRRLTLNARADAAEWMEPLRAYGGDVIAGSPMSLEELVVELERTGGRVPSPRLIFSSGARLEGPLRERVREALGAPVWDAYAAVETGFLAWECPKCPGYHLNIDTNIVEVIKDGRAAMPGETGELVVTNLISSVMPFVRYRLGDLVTVSTEQPVCGRSLPLVSRILGRKDDVVLLPSGSRLGVYQIYMALLDLPFVKVWRFEQGEDGSCLLRIVPRQQPTAEERGEVARRFDDLVRGEVPMRTEFVGEIARDPKSKWKTIVSRVKESEAAG